MLGWYRYFLPLIEGLVFGRDLYNYYESFNVLLYIFGPILQVSLLIPTYKRWD